MKKRRKYELIEDELILYDESNGAVSNAFRKPLNKSMIKLALKSDKEKIDNLQEKDNNKLGNDAG